MLSIQLREDLQSIFEEEKYGPKNVDPSSPQAAAIRRIKKGKELKQKLSSKRPPAPREVGGRVIPPGHQARIRSDGKVMVHDPKRDRYY